jgi:hypothetical protein
MLPQGHGQDIQANGLSFLSRAPTVFGQDALPVLYLGFCHLNSLPNLHPIGFEQSRFVRFVPAICRSHMKPLESSLSVPGEDAPSRNDAISEN